MTKLINGAESGTSDGTAVSAANSGGGPDNAFDSVTGSVFTFDNTHTSHGRHAYKWIPPNSSVQHQLQWNLGGITTVYGRFYLWAANNPVAVWSSIVRTNDAASANLVRLVLDTAGKLRVRNAAGTDVVTFTNAITLSAWNRIEFKFVHSATVGTYEVRLYLGDSLVAVETKTGSNQNFGGSSCDHCLFVQGQPTNQGSSARTYWFDDFEVNTDNFPGPKAMPIYAGISAGVSIVDSPTFYAGAEV